MGGVTQEQIDKGKKLNQAYMNGDTSALNATKAGVLMLNQGSDKANDINTSENSITNSGTADALTNLRNNIAPEGTPNVETPGSTPTPTANQNTPTINKNIDQEPEGQQAMDFNDTKNEDFLFNTMVAGQPVMGGGIATDRARERWNNYNKLSGMSYNILGDSVLNGSVNFYDKAFTDIKNLNPELFAQVQEYVQKKKNIEDINKIGSAIYDGIGGGHEKGSTYAKYKIEQERAGNSNIFDKYNKKLGEIIKTKFGDKSSEMFAITQQIMQNPELQLQKNRVAEIEGEQAKLQEDLYNVGDDVRSVLGSEAPDSLVTAYISNQSKQIQRAVRTKGNELMVEEAKLANYMDDVELTLDAFYKGMQMDADIAEAEAKASAKSSSGGGGGGSSSGGYNKIYDAMSSGSFGGSYTQTAMKKYGYGPVGKDQVLQWIGSNKGYSEILALKGKIPSGDYTKIENSYFINKLLTDPVQAFKELKDFSDKDIKRFIEQSGLSDDEAMEAMEEAGISGGWLRGLFNNRRKNILND